ncbi:hypothetical protein K6625_18380 [Escherichia coli]|jgi:hypothetical protein|uniref:Uncharacterized protein n=3 Tax=Enterobacteriaceae TaxID=543 RepID=A0A1E5M1N4_ECOLX|nr:MULTISPECIES: hypothetical protein [Enterobacteriaceae]EFM2978056.1 hypothetical protein [Salmonella enterica subsp. enterica serovar Typhimurium]EHI5903213.1 hypothetical protein [Salmonella enterica]HAU7686902.1 hypothetical protein [Salmonella enterica subsp. enterica]HCM2740550.1 hypothetical protein [Salmonella enterica subsp. enterica serovar Typhimurium var. monophasic 4,[5],12:i:-]HEB1792917.1 hypothetical protein [Escherichia albertii]HLR33207.1 hypothetical protein [Fodinibius sp
MKLKKLQSLDFVNDFMSHLETDFEKELFTACLRNYASHGNPLRFHNFAFSIRELIKHIIEKKSPNDKLLQASWYKREHEHYEISRRQRLKYCSQAKISDAYLGEEFLEESNERIDEMLKLYFFLNKYTHITEKYMHPSPQEFFLKAKQILQIATEILNGIHICRDELIRTLEDKIRNAVIDTAVSSMPENLVTIANHAYVDYTEVEEFGITSIDDEYINIYASGTVYVTQEYGSRNDGVSLEESYPFTLHMASHLDSPETFEVISEALEVDTSSWYDDGEQEDQMMDMERNEIHRISVAPPDFEMDDNVPF